MRWRLKHKLFGWNYVQIQLFRKSDQSRAHKVIRRVRALPDGRLYVKSPVDDEPTILLLEDCMEWLALTWIPNDDSFKAFAQAVSERLKRDG